MFRLISNSPAALEGYVNLSGALNKGTLPPQTRERIALTVAEINGCSYCLSAHADIGKNLSKLDDAEIAANRGGSSHDPKAEAALRFVAKVVRARGHVSDADVQAVKAAGYDDALVIEIVLHVALNTWTNFINDGQDRHRLSARRGPRGSLMPNAFAPPAFLALPEAQSSMPH